jgi:hypothetical protein
VNDPPRWLRFYEWFVGIFAVALIMGSIFMFMIGNTSRYVADLVAAQNTAALKLWVNLDYFEHHRPVDAPGGTPLPPGLFESLVEFSRTNASLIFSVHRLRKAAIFGSQFADDFCRGPGPTDGSREPADNRCYVVDPRTDAGRIYNQGMYQIELYQRIRDIAQNRSGFYQDCLSAVTVYVMPVLYAVLGACLWAFRTNCRQPNDPLDNRSPDRSSHLVIAAIGGIAISAFSTLFPKDELLSPLALAFAFRYCNEVFTSRLDAYISALSRRNPTNKTT